MPTCDFLALASDCEAVLGFVFGSVDFTVYESYSPYSADLATFSSAAEIAARYPLGKCTGTAPSVLLALLAKGTGQATVTRIALDPAKCDGHTFRYRTDGWGLIQLHLGGIGPKGIVASNTNHNSQARALKWESSRPDLPPVSSWDWPGVQAASRKLNRFIHSLAASSTGSSPILPEAARYFSGAAH
jgi:hypothetical protein